MKQREMMFVAQTQLYQEDEQYFVDCEVKDQEVHYFIVPIDEEQHVALQDGQQYARLIEPIPISGNLSVPLIIESDNEY